MRRPPNVFALASALATGGMLLLGAAPADPEQVIGAQTYAALQSRGEIVTGTPLNAEIDTVAVPIAHVADAQYAHPFRFLLVHEDRPHAFAVPGGNVYITDSLLQSIASREELGAVLCRGTAHTIAHDVVNLANDGRETQSYSLGQLVSDIVSGGRGAHHGDELARYDAGDLHFSRTVELAADDHGAQICAAAGINPWGGVWYLRNHGGSDAPARIAALTRVLEGNPVQYGRFSPDPARATPLNGSGGARKAALAAKG